ncbi:MAG TPA: DEAD/DEAH box helicase [Candidatus Sulfotelmatobacter sp.]|jgi:ATP-dependent RNA helicase RhlE|nr:DEAD/DEAH box helicase [Candidatus Sulfotelmatobacter sp.]
MFRSKSRNTNYAKSGARTYSSRANFRRGTKLEKKLDPNLFIKKAVEAPIQDENRASMLFSEYPIIDKLKRNIADHGYTAPTTIQEKAIPELLAGKDIIGIANTGTGKTAAFLISLINKSYLDKNQRVLIVVPTRELAIQIRDEFRIFAKGLELEAVAIIGGANIKMQVNTLRHNPHFVIGTPGRLKDLIERKVLNLGLFRNIVLDEVDRMVDIGFKREVENLISLLPKIRQSLFFSATLDSKTRDILSNFVTNPVTISVKQQATAENIDQDIVRLPNNRSKIDMLHDLLVQSEFEKVIIFGRTKWGIQKLTNELVHRGFNADAIHGNKNQNQRQRVLQQFKRNEIQILLATDVASRGLDIENVTHVINYDAPTSYDDYIHRIGRTGRAGKKGTALTFVE